MGGRLGILLLAAAALVGVTWIFGGWVGTELPNPQSMAARRHRRDGPEAGKFGEFLGQGIEVAVLAVMGRVVFRLRLSPASRGEGRPISLGLER
jgi:hypothetical protein